MRPEVEHGTRDTFAKLLTDQLRASLKTFGKKMKDMNLIQLFHDKFKIIEKIDYDNHIEGLRSEFLGEIIQRIKRIRDRDQEIVGEEFRRVVEISECQESGRRNDKLVYENFPSHATG